MKKEKQFLTEKEIQFLRDIKFKINKDQYTQNENNLIEWDAIKQHLIGEKRKQFVAMFPKYDYLQTRKYTLDFSKDFDLDLINFIDDQSADKNQKPTKWIKLLIKKAFNESQ